MEHCVQTVVKTSQPCAHTAEPPQKQDQAHGLYIGVASCSIAGHALRIATMEDLHACGAQAGSTVLGPRPRPAIGRQRAHHARRLLLFAPRRRRPTPRCLLGPRPTLAPATAASYQPLDAASDGAALVPLRQLQPLPTRPLGQPPRCQQTRCLHDCCAHSAVRAVETLRHGGAVSLRPPAHRRLPRRFA